MSTVRGFKCTGAVPCPGFRSSVRMTFGPVRGPHENHECPREGTLGPGDHPHIPLISRLSLHQVHLCGTCVARVGCAVSHPARDQSEVTRVPLRPDNCSTVQTTGPHGSGGGGQSYPRTSGGNVRAEPNAPVARLTPPQQPTFTHLRDKTAAQSLRATSLSPKCMDAARGHIRRAIHVPTTKSPT